MQGLHRLHRGWAATLQRAYLSTWHEAVGPVIELPEYEHPCPLPTACHIAPSPHQLAQERRIAALRWIPLTSTATKPGSQTLPSFKLCGCPRDGGLCVNFLGIYAFLSSPFVLVVR
jgi:hypothetical protein